MVLEHISMLTTPSESSQVLVANYDDTDNKHTIMIDNPCNGRIKTGYFSRFHDGKNMLQ